MNKLLLSLVLFICTIPAFAQRFAQYNTGTLYDSFENPAQHIFTPDTSRSVAFNFFIPTASVYSSLNGNGHNVILQRAFFRNYKSKDSSLLKANSISSNHALLNTSVYAIMLKFYSSLNGDQELGFAAQTKAVGRGSFTDQTVSLFSGIGGFKTGTTYTGILNDNGNYQVYDELGFTYRERVDKNFSFGLRLNAVMGLLYNKLQVAQSRVTFADENTAVIAMQGKYYSNYVPGQLSSHDLIPTFRNPGASISIGTMLRTQDGFVLQWNIKDLGFIHWSSHSRTYNFANQQTLKITDPSLREDSVNKTLNRILQSNPIFGSFTTPTDGKAEFSGARTFRINDDEYTKYTPALILSKNLFDQGMTGALVNHLQYHNAILTLTGTYNDLREFGFGTQFMIKSSNAEFFIGSEALSQTVAITRAGLRKNEDALNTGSSYAGGSIYIGFSVKFGNYIEHQMNSSTMPMGERGFFSRLYSRWFKSDKSY